MLNKIKRHFMAQADADNVLTPAFGNLLASWACVALLLAWGWWCWRLGWDFWQTGRGTYKTSVVTAEDSPVRYLVSVFGLLLLGAYSLDGAAQYAVEGGLRIRRWRQSRA